MGERVFFLMLRMANEGLISVPPTRSACTPPATPPADDAAEAGLRAWGMTELRATSLWSLPVVMAELGKFDATAWIPASRADRCPRHRPATGPSRPTTATAGRPIPGAICASPGGHTSLVFDLEHWKPVFLELMDEVVELAIGETAKAVSR